MPIINEIYEDDPSKNRTIDTDTGFYLQKAQSHSLSSTIDFNLFGKTGGDMSLRCEYRYLSTDEEEEKKYPIFVMIYMVFIFTNLLNIFPVQK